MPLNERETAKQAHALITKFQRLYKTQGRGQRTFNRYAAKWGMIDAITDLGIERASELIDYYFKTTRSIYTIEDFYKSYDKLDMNEKLARQDAARRATIRAATEKLVREQQPSIKNPQ